MGDVAAPEGAGETTQRLRSSANTITPALGRGEGDPPVRPPPGGSPPASHGAEGYTRLVHSPLRRILLILAVPALILRPASRLPARSSAAPDVSIPGASLSEARQLIVVTTPDWRAVTGRLERYERTTGEAPWHEVGEPIPVVVGRGGMGWAGGSLPAEGPVKQEGDLRAPAGIFAFGTAFGYAPGPSRATRMPYLTLTPGVECVDDSHSAHYNQVVDRARVTPDWTSSEHMRSVAEYRWGLVIDQNPQARPRGGSCVFLHIWDGPERGTSGCTAMAEPSVEMILGWLDPALAPRLVEMPISEYRLAAKSLRLPPR